MKKNKIYCIKCGEINNAKDKICKRCNSKLKQKDLKLISYIISSGKSDIKSNIDDSILGIIKTFLKNHLYGVILSLTVITCIGANVIIRANNLNDNYVDSKPIFINESVKEDNINSLFNDFLISYNNGDKKALDNLLLQNNYPEIAKKYNIDVTKDNMYIYYDSFKNTYHTTNTISNEDDLSVIYDLSKEMEKDGYEMYDYYLHTVYYLGSVCGLNVNDEDGAIVATFQAEISFIKIDNYYYIASFNLLTKDDEFFNANGYVKNTKDLSERTEC